VWQPIVNLYTTVREVHKKERQELRENAGNPHDANNSTASPCEPSSSPSLTDAEQMSDAGRIDCTKDKDAEEAEALERVNKQRNEIIDIQNLFFDGFSRMTL
jgi:hypothetical protein